MKSDKNWLCEWRISWRNTFELHMGKVRWLDGDACQGGDHFDTQFYHPVLKNKVWFLFISIILCKNTFEKSLCFWITGLMKRRHESFFFCSMASCLLIISLILLLALKNSSRVSEPLLLLSMALNRPLNVKALSKVTVISPWKGPRPWSWRMVCPPDVRFHHTSHSQYSTVQYSTVLVPQID